MSWAAPVLQGASAIFGASQAGNAADAQQEASEAAIAEQRRQYDQNRTDQQPFMGYGTGAGGLAGLDRLNSGDYSMLFNSPEYKARFQGGIQALAHSANAGARLGSGGFQADLQQAGQDYASRGLSDLYGRLQWGANLGQNAAAGVGQAGANMANQIGAQQNNIGQAQAGAYGARAGAGYGLAGIAGNYLSGLGGGGSSYGGGSNASSFGLPSTSTPYGNTNYGSTGGTPGWTGYFG